MMFLVYANLRKKNDFLVISIEKTQFYFKELGNLFFNCMFVILFMTYLFCGYEKTVFSISFDACFNIGILTIKP